MPEIPFLSEILSMLGGAGIFGTILRMVPDKYLDYFRTAAEVVEKADEVIDQVEEKIDSTESSSENLSSAQPKVDPSDKE